MLVYARSIKLLDKMIRKGLMMMFLSNGMLPYSHVDFIRPKFKWEWGFNSDSSHYVNHFRLCPGHRLCILSSLTHICLRLGRRDSISIDTNPVILIINCSRSTRDTWIQSSIINIRTIGRIKISPSSSKYSQASFWYHSLILFCMPLISL